MENITMMKPLLELFTNNQNQLVHKWHHYIPLYARYFKPFQGDKRLDSWRSVSVKG